MLLSEERTDSRVTRTRNLLADALRSLLVEKVFQQITVQDIAARATIKLISWSIYGAALEWQEHASEQSAEDFADDVIPLIAATVAALADSTHAAQP